MERMKTMEITKEMVDYVSVLSRLRLDDQAKEQMQGEMCIRDRLYSVCKGPGQ